MIYRINCTHNNETRHITIDAIDDLDAVTQGIMDILALAYVNEHWALGEITLLNPAGETIHTMPAKVAP